MISVTFDRLSYQEMDRPGEVAEVFGRLFLDLQRYVFSATNRTLPWGPKCLGLMSKVRKLRYLIFLCAITTLALQRHTQLKKKENPSSCKILHLLVMNILGAEKNLSYFLVVKLWMNFCC